MSDYVDFEVRLLDDEDYQCRHNCDTLRGFLGAFFGWWNEFSIDQTHPKIFHVTMSELSLCDVMDNMIASEKRCAEFEIYINYGRYKDRYFENKLLSAIKKELEVDK